MRALVIKKLPCIELHSIIKVEVNNGLLTSKGIKSCIKLEDIILEGARWQVVKAAEEGKEIEVWEESISEWCRKESMTFFADSFYRIAPEPPLPKHVPFTADDWKMFTGKPVKWANDSVYRLIVEFCSDELMFDEDRLSYEYALDNLTFMDGSPFGKKIVS
jgi:hypothetical protein